MTETSEIEEVVLELEKAVRSMENRHRRWLMHMRNVLMVIGMLQVLMGAVIVSIAPTPIKGVFGLLILLLSLYTFKLSRDYTKELRDEFWRNASSDLPERSRRVHRQNRGI